MASLKTEIKIDAGAEAQKALNQFAKDMYEKYGVTIESVRFDWMHTMDGGATLYHSEMTTGSQG